MKDINRIIGKTIKDVKYDCDRDRSELIIKFDDETEICIETEYNTSTMWSEIINPNKNNYSNLIKEIDKEFMNHLNNLDNYKNNSPCDNCGCNPKNGGSGICNCTLNLPEIR
jgi:hypothetical protein